MSSREFWDFVGDHWSVTILLPTILLVIALLAVVTRVWDKREARRR
ncbi:MAG: hypothetical protein AB7J32_08310 [Pseudonocardia sp.]